MQVANKPKNEAERIALLQKLNILDSLEEQQYNDLTYLAAQICEVPIALVSLLDENRQWFKSHHGLNATETPRDYAFCSHAILEEGVFEILDSSKDDRFSDNPLVIQDPHVIFYAGIPLKIQNGLALGTLCVIDNKPNKLTENQILALEALGRQVEALFMLRLNNQALSVLNDSLIEEQEAAKEFYNKIIHVDSLNAFNIHYYISPLATFGGDILLAEKDIHQNNILHLVIADMTGHGLGAAIGLIPLSNAFSLAIQHGLHEEKIIMALNEGIRKFTPPGKYCAACYLQIDFVRKTYLYWNSGIPYPKHYHAHSKKMIDLKTSHLPLGALPSHELKLDFSTESYLVGDKIFLFTDGVLETKNLNKEIYGNERLNKILIESAEGQDEIKNILASLEKFSQNHVQEDDIIMVAVSLT